MSERAAPDERDPYVPLAARMGGQEQPSGVTLGVVKREGRWAASEHLLLGEA